MKHTRKVFVPHIPINVTRNKLAIHVLHVPNQFIGCFTPTSFSAKGKSPYDSQWHTQMTTSRTIFEINNPYHTA